MNIVFWIIMILILICFWFLIAFMFKPVGGLILHIVSDMYEIVKVDNKEEEKNDEEV